MENFTHNALFSKKLQNTPELGNGKQKKFYRRDTTITHFNVVPPMRAITDGSIMEVEKTLSTEQLLGANAFLKLHKNVSVL